MDKGFRELFSLRADCSVSEIGPLLTSLDQPERISSEARATGTTETSQSFREITLVSSLVYVRVSQERIYAYVAAHAYACVARLDCENYVGKTAIRRRCNSLSWTASRVGGNYAELMRSSSCGPRIIYSESASLSPCITRSGFSAAAHVCLVSVRNPRDMPRREINFPILPKRLRWPGDRLCRKTTTAWQCAAHWIENTGRLLHSIDRILQGMLIEANVSKDFRIKKSKRSTKAIRARYRWKFNGKSIKHYQ